MTETIADSGMDFDPYNNPNIEQEIEWLVAEAVGKPGFCMPYFADHGIEEENLPSLMKRAFEFGKRMGSLDLESKESEIEREQIGREMRRELNGLFGFDQPRQDCKFTPDEVQLQNICRHIFSFAEWGALKQQFSCKDL